MKIVLCSRGSVRGTRLIYIIKHQEKFLWTNCGDGFLPRRYGITAARERQREVQQQTELTLLQSVDHFAGRKRRRKTKLRTNVK